ncbi:ZP domain-containing protein-like [Actinia tenebrosa]|uniref:ZP domain-containing protein-like n=1 Tax=Actinia tenebrosa TaxID=6105 RepID=A0A6P8HB35_ACTTE|nr:ZP domain-containing protein-like [Actinia tenebrosa]
MVYNNQNFIITTKYSSFLSSNNYYCNCYHGFTGRQCETRFYGNITFIMDLYQTSNYSTPYSPSAYPVVVYPNQSLWVQYEVKSTTFDLVVFAENCCANNSTNPDSFPQHVFLERGCIVDSTMVYFHNPYSKVQRFSIRSFRFAYSNSHLVCLHCELLVCHQNSTNSRWCCWLCQT